MVMILTGSATSDAYDVAPQAVRKAGGHVVRFGMPVDPGNLLFVGTLGEVPIIGLPGCARSLARNGADWVVERLLCGIDVADIDIAGMGVGGLLKESPARNHPRHKPKE
jgi:molybdenum cofactor cytidylyltransferase